MGGWKGSWTFLLVLVTLSTGAPFTEGQGACCFQDDGCKESATGVACGVLGGVFFEGESCSDQPCGLGACCNELSCATANAFNCIVGGRTFGGAGTTCLDDPCESDIGACCNDGACSFISPADCDMQGGIWLGAGTNCVNDMCVIGGCCQPGQCNDLPGFECSAAGGTFFSNGLCDDGVCESTFDCPADALVGQSVDNPNFFAAYLSEVSAGVKLFDNYSDVPGAINGVKWFGLEISSESAILEDCNEKTPEYLVEFYEDDAGEIGELVCSQMVTADRLTTKVSYDGLSLVIFEASLTEPCVLPSGWLSIQGMGAEDCRLFWITSNEGDRLFRCDGCNFGDSTDDDLSFCLLGDFGSASGACCDEKTGMCGDNVDIQDCLGTGRRFEPDTTCDALDPLCSAIAGGCCFVDGTCSIESELSCETLGGAQWLGEGSTCDDCPARGACCVDEANCTITTEPDCLKNGFFWAGPDTACEECPDLPECPEDSLFTQPPDGPSGFEAGTSELSSPFTRFENFSGVAGPIDGLTFWGFELFPIGGGGFQVCTESDPSFDITFHPDLGGLPGPAVCTYELQASRTSAQLLFFGAELMEYTIDLPEPCVLVDGWVSIVGRGDVDCFFLWQSSNFTGNGFSLCEGCSFEDQIIDLAVCLRGPVGGVSGACCDEMSGDCSDDVDISECTADGTRFTPNETCDALDPACGVILGACCFSDASCSILEEDACDMQGGDWVGANAQCDQCPCVLPCPAASVPEGEPVCFDNYVDTFNSGCDGGDQNLTQSQGQNFSPIGLCETICGTSGVFLEQSEFTGDFDWYEINLDAPTQLTWRVEAEFPVQTGIINGNFGCEGAPVLSSAVGDPCEVIEIFEPLQPGRYWLVVGPFGANDLAFCGARYTVRATSSVSCPGDGDGDGDIDLDDYAAFRDCVSGPAGGIAGGCQPFDGDDDLDVDLIDFGLWQRLFTGSQ